MGALSTYTTQVQRLLHDQNFAFWPQAELTDYINEARNRVAEDTKCLRQQATSISILVGVEAYNIAATVPTIGAQVVDIMNINLYWGQRRYPLLYYSWSEFTAKLRAYNNYQSKPIAYTRVGATQVYVAPIPDQTYVSDWDVAITPPPLVSDATIETIPIPFQEPIQYYAAYKAKFKEQAMAEAAMFKKEYLTNLLMCARSFQTRIIPNIYA